MSIKNPFKTFLSDLAEVKPSALVLVVVNLIPIFGVAFYQWTLFSIMLLFWLENFIIGLITIIKILVNNPRELERWIEKIFVIPFFLMHYGIFTLVHGAAVLLIFGGEDFSIHMIEEDPSQFFTVFTTTLEEYGMIWPFLALLASHLFSLGWNFFYRGEWLRKDNMKKIMLTPYARIGFLQVMVIFVGGLYMAISAPPWLMAIIIFLKIMLDLFTHALTHRKK